MTVDGIYRDNRYPEQQSQVCSTTISSAYDSVENLSVEHPCSVVVLTCFVESDDDDRDVRPFGADGSFRAALHGTTAISRVHDDGCTTRTPSHVVTQSNRGMGGATRMCRPGAKMPSHIDKRWETVTQVRCERINGLYCALGERERERDGSHKRTMAWVRAAACFWHLYHHRQVLLDWPNLIRQALRFQPQRLQSSHAAPGRGHNDVNRKIVCPAVLTTCAAIACPLNRERSDNTRTRDKSANVTHAHRDEKQKLGHGWLTLTVTSMFSTNLNLPLSRCSADH